MQSHGFPFALRLRVLFTGTCWAFAGLALFGAGCTNEYHELAYLPDEGEPDAPGPASCDNDGDCAGDAQCEGGICSCLGGSPCSSAETCCAPQGCRDLDSDPRHCGGCGQDCPPGWSCNNGTCGP